MFIRELEKIIKKLVPESIISIPPNPINAHLATNSYLINKENGIKIFNILKSLSTVEKVEIEKGFINIWIKNNENYLEFEPNINETESKINVEYVSPNPTGSIHLGACRNGVIGVALVKILSKFLKNQEVISEMYINDRGNQVAEFLESINFFKTGKGNLYYKGDYVEKLAKNFDGKTTIINHVVGQIIKDLALISIHHDVVTYETSLSHVDKIIFLLKDHIRKGKLTNQKSEGDLLILKLKNEEVVLQKSNGEYTYFFFDIVYMYDKYLRGFKKQICVLAEDHYLHAKRLVEVANLLKIDYNPIHYAMVVMKTGDSIFKLSKREGRIVTIQDILQHCGVNDFYWTILKHSLNKVITIDLLQIQKEELFKIEYWTNINLNEVTAAKETNDNLWSLLYFWPKYLEISLYNPHAFADYALKLAFAMETSTINMRKLGQKLLKIICSLIFPENFVDN